MRGTQLARDLFNKTKKYMTKFNREDRLKGDFVSRIFVKSKDYDSFTAQYDKCALIEAQNIIAYNEAVIENLENQLAAVKNSRSYRLGRALTAPIRIFKNTLGLRK
jgi:hypothetical protein